VGDAAYLWHHFAGRNGLSHEVRVVALPRVSRLRCSPQQPPHAEVNPARCLSHRFLTQSRLVAARTPCTGNCKSSVVEPDFCLHGHYVAQRTQSEYEKEECMRKWQLLFSCTEFASISFARKEECNKILILIEDTALGTNVTSKND
jgi:hypothetical protein